MGRNRSWAPGAARRAVATLALAAVGVPGHAAPQPAATPAVQPAPQAPSALPAIGTNAQDTTVSGLSSGGFMAVQYAVAFSRSTSGVGVVAGGPYGCGLGGPLVAVACMNGAASSAGSYTAAVGYAALGAIDPLAHLARQRVYLFHGSADTTVSVLAMDALRRFYAAAQVPDGHVTYLRDMKAGHAYLSQDFGGACGATAPPFVNRCRSDAAWYDQPGAILASVLGRTMNPRAPSAAATPQPFDQRAYAPASSGLAETGYVYVPGACREGGAGCSVHVVFHGCMQGADVAGDAIYGRLGYNEWADSNRLVILYPQAARSPAGPANPFGCWDWWGYDGRTLGAFGLPAYPTREGTQLAAIHRMVEDLAGLPR